MDKVISLDIRHQVMLRVFGASGLTLMLLVAIGTLFSM